MTSTDRIRRYPRLARVVLAVTDETNLMWVAQILECKSAMAKGIVREAIKLRHSYKLGPAAYRDLEKLISSIPAQTTFQVSPT